MTDPTAEGAALRGLLDEASIRHRLGQYSRAIDRLDLRLLRELYHPDGTDDHAPFFTGTIDDFITYMEQSAERPIYCTRHSISNVVIEVNGDVAASESYFEAFHARDVDGAPIEERLLGRYLDRWEKRDGQWRIRARRVVWDWSNAAATARGPVGIGMAGGTVGKRSVEDESYLWLGGSLRDA